MNSKLILSVFSSLILWISVSAQKQFDHSVWDQALLLNVSDDGFVNYEGFMKDSSLLYEYFKELSYNTPKDYWSKEEKMAYWINAYNAYTVKLVIDSYPIKSIQDIDEPWDKKFFKIDGEWYSLNELEHEIIRKFHDPRIHFAINCAAYSCPVVWNRAYTADNLNKALDNQSEKFINDPTRNTITKKVVMLSQIFKWYKKDFKSKNGSVEKFVNKYAHFKISNQKSRGFKDYDWKLNEVINSDNNFVIDQKR